MEYRNFTIITFTSNNIKKCTSKTNHIEKYNGFNCFIHSKHDENCNIPLDYFDIAIGIEIKGKNYDELEMFIKKYIDKNYNTLKQLENSYFCSDSLS
jgi:hypothetical protein